MRNREIVIKGLQCCKGDGGPVHTCPPDCPYADVDEDAGFCNEQLMQDAIVLLKAEEPPKNVYCRNCGACLEVPR